MGLVRTKSGLSNKHIFYGVDYVVYVEGGSVSYSVEDVGMGKCSLYSEDINFWQKIFDVFWPEKKIKLYAVGSKSSILPFAEGIQDGSIKNTIAAIDRDYDTFNGRKIEHPLVFYTKGYSWENDVFVQTNMNEVVKSLLCVSDADYDQYNEIKMYHAQYKKCIRPAVCFDLVLKEMGDFLIPRNPTGGGIVSPKEPKINIEVIRSFVREKYESLRSANRLYREVKIDSCADSYGHMFCSYCVNVIKSIVKQLRGKKVARDTIIYVSLEKMYLLMSSGECDLYDHYEQQFARVV